MRATFQRNIFIFPEGTRLTGQNLGAFKKGAFEIAIKANVKVQPIVIQNYTFIDHEDKFFGRGQLKMKIFPPIEAIKDESADSFSRRVHELMSFEFQNINKL